MFEIGTCTFCGAETEKHKFIYRKCEVRGRRATLILFADEETVFVNVDTFATEENITKIADKVLQTHAVPQHCHIDKVRQVVAIVEYENGTIEKIDPSFIRFTDKRVENAAGRCIRKRARR